VQSGELELIYTHLVSMQNFATVRDRLASGEARSRQGNGDGAAARAN
jgi:hypothetical protein